MLRPLIDILMTILLLLSMSYELIGTSIAEFFGFDSYDFAPIFHEAIGMLLIILFVYHTWLNRWWLKGIFKGKYNFTRAILSFVNVALIIDVIFLLITGVLMSKTVELVESDGLMSFARVGHMLASFWGFVLMSFHAGLNWNIFSGMIRSKMKVRVPKVFAIVLALGFVIYGAIAFVRNNLWDYMTLKTEFIFFDFDVPVIYFLLDYACIMIMFGIFGHCVILLLRKFRV